ncbi:MAG: selenocysteine-specific translation elongation factor [Acidobacteria bacterium]|nr:selenocysteine-specific translation elongation factor [Acidobacteriota bacterium]
MSSIIVGTAGHIDHGKTTLVHALTGIDTDRLAEEKRRGISIELGFAHLDLGGGSQAGFVDVPGHERFVKTMVAGATGIDLVLLVISADESIKPQTREHFDICRLLGVHQGIVVITKSDAVEPDLVELVKLEAEEFVAGSFLQGAPILAVSAKTGAGLDELKQTIRRLADAAPARASRQILRLPIDRAFAMKGFGAVVTGTLTAGTIQPEQEVEVQPIQRRLRVRGVQVHGRAAKSAHAGQRTAVNLAGIDHTDLARGMVLTTPGALRPVAVIDCRITLLPGVKPVHTRTPVHFHAGTAEVPGAMRPLGDGLFRVRLREPLLLLPGDRFIIRKFSPVVTIGGGEVVEIDPPRKSRAARLAPLSIPDRASVLVKDAAHGIAKTELLWRLGEPVTAGTVVGDWCVDPTWLDTNQFELEKTLAAYHNANPLLPGMPREELRTKVIPNAPPALFDALLMRGPRIAAQGDTVRLATHRVQLQQDEREARNKIEEAFRNGGLAVPAQREVLAASGVDATRSAILLNTLLKERKLVRVSADLVFHHAAIDHLKAMLAARKGTKFGVSEFKEWTGCSRKFAIPLLEFLDRERLTRRDGDHRVVV